MELVNWRTSSTPIGGKPQTPADDHGVEVHHTATDDKSGPSGGADNPAELVALMRSVWRYHVNTKGWADIFYGFVVARDGSYAEGRGFDRGTSNDHRWLTICLAGNYDEIEATPAQVATVAALRAEARKRGAGGELRGHGDRAATACPGEGGRWLLSLLAAGGSGDAPPAPPAAAQPATFTVDVTWRQIEQGARGALVRSVQALLVHTYGQDGTVGSVDGVFGRRTGDGVRAVQAFFGLDVDGIVGPNTAGVLLADWEAIR